MKNINIYGLLLIGLSLMFACSPIEDDLDEINESSAFVKDMVYTLVDEDYELIDGECDCSGYGSFGSEDDAKSYIPYFLSTQYSALGATSSALVTYNLYNGSSPDLNGELKAFTVTDAEYDELGYGEYKNFGDLNKDIPVYASYKWADASDGDYMDVTHAFYSSATGFVPDSVSRAGYTVAYGWMHAELIPDAAYGDYFGESGIDFSYEDEGVEKIPVYLRDMNKFAQDGNMKLIQYNYDNGEEDNPTTPALALYTFSGGNWLYYNDHFQVTDESISFGNDGLVWVPDNTIKYELSGGDYSSIAAATATSNPDGSASMDQYGNYDLSVWTSDEIYESINALMLSEGAFIKELDQKYSITYATYSGASGTGVLNLIYDGTNYIINE
ncbi:MAG: hypothetical protein OCD76_16865 [Reichenbachiella sp.]